MVYWLRACFLAIVLAVAVMPSAGAEDFEKNRQAAENGDPKAQYLVGQAYAVGDAVEQDLAKAVLWFRKAADQDFAEAQYALGSMHEIGRGVEKDYEKAAFWFRKAADQGHDRAQLWLGTLYVHGRVVIRDYVEAYKWLNLAGTHGNDIATAARKQRDALEGRLAPEQIAEGQKRAERWQQRRARQTPPPETPAPRNPADYRLAATGSGFLVNGVGYVLTNNHVVDGCLDIRITGSTSPVQTAAHSKEGDLALLWHSPGEGAVPARWRSGPGAPLGEEVVVAGYPLPGILTADLGVTTGTISALAGAGEDWHLFQITAPIQPGNSGGPLLDRAGRVTGIVVAQLDEMVMAERTGDIPQNVGFAIRSSVAQTFMDAHSVAYDVSDDNAGLSTTEIAAEARGFTVRIECWR